jgi:hypothetical protein
MILIASSVEAYKAVDATLAPRSAAYEPQSTGEAKGQVEVPADQPSRDIVTIASQLA